MIWKVERKELASFKFKYLFAILIALVIISHFFKKTSELVSHYCMYTVYFLPKFRKYVYFYLFIYLFIFGMFLI